MRALAVRGDIAAALAAYDQLRQLLREELGVSPSPAAQTMHARLLHGQSLEARNQWGPATASPGVADSIE
jgi:DNA-binding SARP family transcriptional activator